MGIIDREAALERVQEFLRYVAEFRSLDKDIRECGWTDTDALENERDQAELGILRLQSLVEDIGQTVEPHAETDRFRSYVSDCDSAWRATIRLVGILEQIPTADRIFGPAGPILSASRLHPWVWNAAVDLWRNQHYKEAVFRAAAAIEKQLQLKLDRGDLSGQALYTEAFGINSGQRLRFQHIKENTDDGKLNLDWKSAHLGAMNFGTGCAMGIRNPLAHGTEALNEHEALERLAALSVLARWVESARVQPDKAADHEQPSPAPF